MTNTRNSVKYFSVGIVLGVIFGFEAFAFNFDRMGLLAIAYLGIQSGCAGFLAARYRSAMAPLPLGTTIGMASLLIFATVQARTVFVDVDSVLGKAVQLFVSHVGIGAIIVLVICWAAALIGAHMRRDAGEKEQRRELKVSAKRMSGDDEPLVS